MQLFPLYILPLLNVYRNANDFASRVMQLYDSQPIIYSANESLNAITSVLLFTFLLMARKLNSFLLQGTEEICGVRHLQTADLQTCRLADLQTFVTSANHVTLDNNIVTRS